MRVDQPTVLLGESSDWRGPSAPRHFTAVSVLSTSVTLSWRPPSTSVIGYIVYWRESSSRRSLLLLSFIAVLLLWLYISVLNISPCVMCMNCGFFTFMLAVLLQFAPCELFWSIVFRCFQPVLLDPLFGLFFTMCIT